MTGIINFYVVVMHCCCAKECDNNNVLCKYNLLYSCMKFVRYIEWPVLTLYVSNSARSKCYHGAHSVGQETCVAIVQSWAGTQVAIVQSWTGNTYCYCMV